jgi:hypothetical protein
MPKHARHLNAARHGLRAASLVLPWEDAGEFAGLRVTRRSLNRAP